MDLTILFLWSALRYREFLPHAQSVLEGLVKMGFYNIFPVCHHQGEGGQQALCMKLVAANLGLEVPNAEHPHWWGTLSPDDGRPRSPSIQIVTTTIGLRDARCRLCNTERIQRGLRRTFKSTL